MPTNLRVAAFFVDDDATGITFKGFEVIGVKVGDQEQSEAFRIKGQADIVNVAAHDNEAIGFTLLDAGPEPFLIPMLITTLDPPMYPRKIPMVLVLMQRQFPLLTPVHGITATMVLTVSVHRGQWFMIIAGRLIIGGIRMV